MNIIALIRRFVPPYMNRMVWNILFNLSSTILSLFSFAAIIPVLYILFGLTSNEVEWVDMQQVHGVEALIDAARNNMYYLLNEQIATRGASVVLLMVGLFW